jgi:hypothetical protein
MLYPHVPGSVLRYRGFARGVQTVGSECDRPQWRSQNLSVEVLPVLHRADDTNDENVLIDHGVENIVRFEPEQPQRAPRLRSFPRHVRIGGEEVKERSHIVEIRVSSGRSVNLPPVFAHRVEVDKGSIS